MVEFQLGASAVGGHKLRANNPLVASHAVIFSFFFGGGGGDRFVLPKNDCVRGSL